MLRKTTETLSSSKYCLPVISITLKDIFVLEDGLAALDQGRCNLYRALGVWRAALNYLRFQCAQIPRWKYNKFAYEQLYEQELIPEDYLWKLSY